MIKSVQNTILMMELFKCILAYYNLVQKICRLFHALAQFLFSISERNLDYYHQEVNVRVVSRVAGRRKTLRKLRSFKKVPEMQIWWRVHSRLPKRQISAVRHSIEKHILRHNSLHSLLLSKSVSNPQVSNKCQLLIV